MDKPYERLRNDTITILKAFDEVMHAKMGDTVTIRTDKGIFTRPATYRDTIDLMQSEWEDTVMRLNEIGIDLGEESRPLDTDVEE
jgi:hypothetical protein